MRLPNGYGSVSKLKGNRRKPWIVRKWDSSAACSVPIGYARTKKEAMELLDNYNHSPYDLGSRDITVAEIFEAWKKVKSSKFGDSRMASLVSTYNRHYTTLQDIPIRNIKAWQVQEIIDRCEKGTSVQRNIRTLWGHLENFAREREISTSGFADLLTSKNGAQQTERTVFSEDEIDLLWKRRDIKGVDEILLFLYTGFRISEALNLSKETTDLEQGTFRGGVKTAAGKNRLVPIHSRIRPIVERLYSQSVSGYLIEQENGKLYTNLGFRRSVWDEAMKWLQFSHIPHETRHTFRSRLDSAGANKVCVDRLMGHKSPDTGERVYTHKTIQELKDTIELLV